MKENNNMKCWHCKSDLIWGGDHDMDDDQEGEGIVTKLTCSNVKCITIVEVYHYYDIDPNEGEE